MLVSESLERSPRRRRSRRVSPRKLAYAALAVVALALCFPIWGAVRSHVLPDRVALRHALAAPEYASLKQAYADREFKPIWLNGRSAPAAGELIHILETSAADGLSPGAYRPKVLDRKVADLRKLFGSDRIRTELLLSSTYVRYVRDLHTPAPGADLVYTDPELPPLFRNSAGIMRHLALSASPHAAMRHSTRMNVLYARMRGKLARLRAGRRADPATEGLLVLNLDRLRALPSELGPRFVLVDAASNHLWLYEGDKAVDSMKVVVGSPSQQTPQMAGLIRYAIYNPFWNVPPDLTRDRYAARIAADRSALAALHMDAWSDFTPRARVIDPNTVDWRGVAKGTSVAWLRQRPGPQNSMGSVKFMLPNALGIYLHDTPQKALFSEDRRYFSAGCVRVEDSRRLGRWLFEDDDDRRRGSAGEQRFDLPTAVPVYIVYLTVALDPGPLRLQADVYGRDRKPAAAAAAVAKVS